MVDTSLSQSTGIVFLKRAEVERRTLASRTRSLQSIPRPSASPSRLANPIPASPPATSAESMLPRPQFPPPSNTDRYWTAALILAAVEISAATLTFFAFIFGLAGKL
jgi:hypothetical protein